MNPFYGTDLQPPDDLASDLDRAGVIVCNLRSYHPLSKPQERYELWSYERARTSDAHALRIVAEWWESDDGDEQRPAVGRGAPEGGLMALTAAEIADIRRYAQELANQAPSLTPEQRDRLKALLRRKPTESKPIAA